MNGTNKGWNYFNKMLNNVYIVIKIHCYHTNTKIFAFHVVTMLLNESMISLKIQKINLYQSIRICGTQNRLYFCRCYQL